MNSNRVRWSQVRSREFKAVLGRSREVKGGQGRSREVNESKEVYGTL